MTIHRILSYVVHVIKTFNKFLYVNGVNISLNTSILLTSVYFTFQ